MPTTYTHHRFGGECIGTLGKEPAAAVVARRPLFDTGVHGPDLLFYYRAPLPTSVAKRGSALHRESARSFFEHARLVWNTRSDKEGMLAYLLGFLAHFALDSACHGFINSECARLGATHNRLEAVWDARLMLRDGRRPSQVYRGEALKPDAANAAVIAPFYGLSDAEALSAMRGQARVMRLLRSPRGVKKRLLRGAIRAAHLPGGFDDLFIDDSIPPALSPALDRLDALYSGALAEYPDMARQLYGFLQGNGELPARFDRDFE